MPYLLSILFLGTGYFLSEIGSEIKNYPLLVYHISNHEKIDESRYRYRIILENVTNDQLFKELTFLVDYNNSKNYKMISARPVFKPPVHFRDFENQKIINGLFYEFSVQNFQPGWEVPIVVDVTGPLNPTISISSDELINFKEKSITTSIYKNKTYLIFSLAILWVLIIMLYLIFYARINRKKNVVFPYDLFNP